MFSASCLTTATATLSPLRAPQPRNRLRSHPNLAFCGSKGLNGTQSDYAATAKSNSSSSYSNSYYSSSSPSHAQSNGMVAGAAVAAGSSASVPSNHSAPSSPSLIPRANGNGTMLSVLNKTTANLLAQTSTIRSGSAALFPFLNKDVETSAASSSTLPSSLPSTTPANSFANPSSIAIDSAAPSFTSVSRIPSLVRSTSVGQTTGGGGGVGAGGGIVPGSIPLLNRQATRGATSTLGPITAIEWRGNVSIEERMGVRSKLRDAYTRNCPTYASLLEIVSAIDEELIFSSCPSRLDYFKSGIDWDNRIRIKKQQLTTTPITTTATSTITTVGDENGVSKSGTKRGSEEASGTTLSTLAPTSPTVVTRTIPAIRSPQTLPTTEQSTTAKRQRKIE